MLLLFHKAFDFLHCIVICNLSSVTPRQNASTTPNGCQSRGNPGRKRLQELIGNVEAQEVPRSAIVRAESYPSGETGLSYRIEITGKRWQSGRRVPAYGVRFRGAALAAHFARFYEGRKRVVRLFADRRGMEIRARALFLGRDGPRSSPARMSPARRPSGYGKRPSPRTCSERWRTK